ncbi:HCLS1-binding protein 3 [Puntigrus tetrazona]|uniref:HCLS1-binding protein 3 n=1 Tax=Puntigrus tetrazona TaxID=1606681 RepID=UPI001C89C200|nr:HCLS1-binding protein 3 [Puntigrus tetrazona]
MPDGLITNRPLENEATGIDLHVPLYQEIRGSIITGHVEYQIVVVTRLASFKSAKHKTGDIVQFVVSKKYSEIEEFYYSLMTKYPSIHLPPMPRKALFVGETDLQKRRAAFDKLVKFFSKHPILANCTELLEFLGAKTVLSDVKTTNEPERLDQDQEDGLDFFEREEPSNLKMAVAVDISDQSVKKSYEEKELTGLLTSKLLKKHDNLGSAKSVSKPSPKTLFDEEDDPDKNLFSPAVKGEMKLFDSVHLGDTNTLLFSKTNNSIKSTETKVDEDIDDLFRVELDFDKLLTVSKKVKHGPDPSLKAKPGVKAEPMNQKSSTFTQSTDLQLSRAEAMNQMDILQYIQQNDLPATDDLDLFKL